MISSLTEMLELPNFDHMTTFKLKTESRDKTLLATSWTEIMTSLPFFKKSLFLEDLGEPFLQTSSKL